jgi:uncharacterized membrane protein
MTTAISDFVRRVDQACADLPDPQRRRLIADLEDHLRELDAHAITELGDPIVYAAELRTALDLPSLAVPAPPLYPMPVAPPVPSPGGVRPWLVVVLICLGVAAIVPILIVGAVVFGLTATSHGTNGPTAVTVSAQPIQSVEVPALVGMARATATDTAQAIGLVVDVRTVRSASPAGVVVAQSPAPFTQVPAGTRVLLRVSIGQ